MYGQCINKPIVICEFPHLAAKARQVGPTKYLSGNPGSDSFLVFHISSAAFPSTLDSEVFPMELPFASGCCKA